jgi:hypothetical protein
MSGGIEGAGGQGQAQVRFITNATDIELPEGKRQLLVPKSKDPDHLNVLLYTDE